MHLIPFLRSVLALTRPYRLRLVLGIVCGLIAGICSPLLLASAKLVIQCLFPDPHATTLAQRLAKAPAAVQWVMNHLFPHGFNIDVTASTTLTILVIATIPLTMLLRGLFGYLNLYLMNWVCLRTIHDLRARLFRHLLGLSSGFFSENSTGGLMAQLSAIAALQGTIGNSLVTIVREPITVLATVVYLVYSQPKLTVVALIVFPAAFVPFAIFARKVRKSAAGMHQEYTEQNKLIHEALTGYRIVKAYNLEKSVDEEFGKTSKKALSHAMRVVRAAELPGPLIEFIGSLGVAIFFAYIWFWERTKMTPDDLFPFVVGILMLYQPIKSIIRLHSQLEQAETTTHRVFELLATESSIVEPVKPVPLIAAGKDIHFEKITFSYGEKTILREIELTVKAGQFVALVGSTGSGKTTLTNLLLRFYDPQVGRVLIGGTDIRDISTHDLRSHIAVVTQETILFNDAVRRNIELGRPGSSLEEVQAAAVHAHAHDFILEKPQGYDTIVGEKGVTLSGGQKQRLAIARAILRDAPILILDEATNSLDAESERVVQAALEELMKDRTTICIAHRLSTIQRADVIIVLDQGRIVERGRHEELLKLDGKYRRLYELQFAT